MASGVPRGGFSSGSGSGEWLNQVAAAVAAGSAVGSAASSVVAASAPSPSPAAPVSSASAMAASLLAAAGSSHAASLVGAPAGRVVRPVAVEFPARSVAGGGGGGAGGAGGAGTPAVAGARGRSEWFPAPLAAQPVSGPQRASLGAAGSQGNLPASAAPAPPAGLPGGVGGVGDEGGAGAVRSGLVLAINPANPREVVAFRTEAEKAINREHLRLDHRGLQAVPLFEGEQALRILNLEENQIARISNLSGLSSLVLLDLTGNRVTDIGGLGSVPTLRVLMLGRNQVRRIQNLDHLTALEVLDLHGNQVSEIENLAPLRSLRVLNLAGNRIRTVRNLDRLECLVELNLRRNQITSVRHLDRIGTLERLFLSGNNLQAAEAMPCVFQLRSLTDLALDGNPIATQPEYRLHVIGALRSLRQLDALKVSAAERREAEDRALTQASLLLGSRSDDLRGAAAGAAQIGEVGAGPVAATVRPDSSAQHAANGDDFVGAAILDASAFTSAAAATTTTTSATVGAAAAAAAATATADADSGAATSPLEMVRRAFEAELASTAVARRKRRSGGPATEPNADTTAAGGAEAAGSGGGGGSVSHPGFFELDRATATLTVTGPAFACLSSEVAERARHIEFRYVMIDRVAENVPLLQRLPRLVRLTLTHNNVVLFGQLDPLALLRLEELTVRSSPAVVSPLCRPYVLARMPALAAFNGVAVHQAEADEARRVFGGLVAHWSNRSLVPNQVPATQLAPAARAQVRKEAVSHVQHLVRRAENADRKFAILHREWDSIVRELVDAALGSASSASS